MSIKTNSEPILFQHDPLTLNENSFIEEELQIIIAAKRVDVIDGYAQSLNIDKFDL